MVTAVKLFQGKGQYITDDKSTDELLTLFFYLVLKLIKDGSSKINSRRSSDY